MSKNNNVPHGSLAADIFEWIEMIVLSACIVLLIFTFVARPAMVDGPSMDDTLHHKEMLIISDVFYEPKRGDIVVFQKINSSHSAPIVKRVIATEGEEITLIDSPDSEYEFNVIIKDKNGVAKVLEEPYAKWTTDQIVGFKESDYPIKLEEGQLFVMGDNRNHSLDSRDSVNIGIVDEKEIIGKVVIRTLPIKKFGKVN